MSRHVVARHQLVKLPRLALGDQDAVDCRHARQCDSTVRYEQLTWCESREHRINLHQCGHREAKLAGRDIGGRKADQAARRHTDGNDEVVSRSVEQLIREGNARRNRLHDFAAHDSFRELRILHLLADGDTIALGHETAQIFGPCLHRHAREWYFGGTAIIARGEGESEHSRGGLGVLVEHLVEVAHAEEEDRALMPRLDLAILLHHRRRHGAAHGVFLSGAGSSVVTNPMMPRCLSAATSSTAV